MMQTNKSHLLLCLIGGVSCLLPLYFDPTSHLEETRLRQAVSSTKNRESSIAIMVLVFPILMEVFTDCIISFIKRGNPSKIECPAALLNHCERLVFFIGSVAVPFTAFFPSDTINWAYMYLCLSKCQLALVGGAVVISLCRYDERYWSVRLTYLYLTLLITGSVLSAFTENTTNSTDSYYKFQIRNAAYSLVLGATGIFYLCCARWLYAMTPRIFFEYIWIKKRTTIKLTSDANTENLVFPLMYILTSIISSSSNIAIAIIYPGIGNLTDDALFYHNFASIFFLCFLTYLSSRMVKLEVVRGLNALIESKKMYVRYISHELRTPLNSAFLGLKLVCDDLDTTTDEKDIEHYETLLGVQSACKSAVEILNDLLCFDKLESGILEMHKLDVSVIPFITNCVNMFSSQAKEAGIDISYITGRPYVTQEHGALLESDTVLMDKFKMDQVLRNLISNALKFTPRGGSVTVSASFIPDEDRDVFQSTSVVKGDLGKGGSRARPSLTFPFPFRFPYPCGMSPKIFVNTSTDTNVEAAEGHIISIHEAPGDIDASHDDLNGPAIVTSTQLSLTNSNAHPPSDLPDNNPVSGGHDVGWDGSKANTKAKMPAPDREVQHIRNPHNRRSSSCNPGLGPLDGMHKVVTGKLRFSVTDTGCGISDANQVRLFKEIVQFNPELLQAGGGSGLGLWITSSIVQMHNGSVQAYSAGAGKGSTFTVEIDMHRLVNRACSPDPSPSPSYRPPPETGHSPPVHSSRECSSNDTPRPHYSSTARDTEPLSPPNTSPWGSTQDESSPLPRRMHPQVISVEGATERGYRTPGDRPTGAMSLDYSLKHDIVHDILVVDDSTLNRKLLCKVLKSSGYSCEEAADGLCAVDKVKSKMASKSGNYDVILMDFVMPRMDGPAATQAIRALGYSGPIFGLTGNALSSDMKYFTDHGANAVLAKPFDFTTFKQLLKTTKESTVTHVVATTSI